MGSESGGALECDPTAETCEAKLALGVYCEEDTECSTEHCVPDDARRYRCCEAACTNGCNATGECFLPPKPAGTTLPPKGTAPSTTPSERESEAAADASTTSTAEPMPSTGVSEREAERAREQAARDDSGDTTEADAPSDGQSDVTDGPTELEIIECAAGATRSCSAAGALGNCGLGEQPCENGHWSTCTVQPKTVDSCALEGDDADCDGVPNGGCDCEGDCEPMQTTTDECAPGDVRACDEHPGLDGKGICRAGTQSCQATESGNRFGVCTGAVGPANADSCASSGDDSNCNGKPNEGCAAMPPVEQPPVEDPPVEQPPTMLQGTLLWSFDSNAQGWQLRLTDPDSLKSSSQVTFGSDQGDPSAGSLLVKMPFSGHNQKLEFNVSVNDSLDVRGKQFRARVMLKSGLSTDTNAPGGIKFFAKAGDDYVYVSGRWRYLTTPGQWEEVFLDPSAPDLKTGDFDLSDVREVGFELRTFQDTTQISPAVVYVDSITY